MLLICKLMHCIHMLQFNFHFVCLTFRPLFRILFYCILFFFTFYFLYIFIFICQFILSVLLVNKDFFLYVIGIRHGDVLCCDVGTEYECQNSKCIPLSSVNNSYNDCGDNSDEGETRTSSFDRYFFVLIVSV